MTTDYELAMDTWATLLHLVARLGPASASDPDGPFDKASKHMLAAISSLADVPHGDAP